MDEKESRISKENRIIRKANRELDKENKELKAKVVGNAFKRKNDRE